MRPLQDQCYPTPLPKLDEMLRKDMGLRYVPLTSADKRPLTTVPTQHGRALHRL